MKRQGGIVISDESLGARFEAFGQKKPRDIDHRRKLIEEDEYELGYGNNDYEYSRPAWQPDTEPTPRKVVRVRVPVIRNRTERQHKYTVVRRRPLATYAKPAPSIVISSPTARRIVVTRVRPRGPANQFISFPEDYQGDETLLPITTTRHRVTVTRRRKIRPTTISETFQRPRVTRKKLVNVRPIVAPTPTFAIITTGFYSAPSDSDEDEDNEDSIEDQEPVIEVDEEAKMIDYSKETPNLEDSPNDIESNPQNNFEDNDDKQPEKFDLKVPEEPSKVEEEPIIITDNFFYPASDSYDEEDEKDEIEEEDRDYYETTTESSENESVTTEEPRLINHDEDTSEAPNKDPSEPATLEVVTKVPPSSVESTEPITEKIGDQSEDITELPAATTTTTSFNEIDDQTELTTLQGGMVDGLSTEVDSNETDSTSYPETTENPVTISIEESVEDTTPETPEKTLQMNIEEELDTNSNKSVIPDVTTISEEVFQDFTTPMSLTEPSIVESTIPETAFESPVTEAEIPALVVPVEVNEEDLSVVPLESYEKSFESSSDLIFNTLNIRPSSTGSPDEKTTNTNSVENNFEAIDSDVPSVIPLEAESTMSLENEKSADSSSTSSVTTSYASPTTEDIEAGLADELYLSLSRPDFPQILPSKSIDTNEPKLTNYDNVVPTPELSTSVYYTETVVTSTKLRTYTYVVTKLNGLETEVTSSTTVRPRITTLTLTVPVTVTISPTLESSARNTVVVAPVYSPVSVAGE